MTSAAAPPPLDPQLYQRLRAIVEALPVGVWLTDRHGAILLDNPAGVAIWGRRFRDADHLAQCCGWRADTGQSLGAGDWSLARVLAGGEPVLGEVLEIVAFDGARKTIRSSALPLRDEGGALTGALVLNEEITALCAAEAALRDRDESYRAFFDLTAVGAGEVDVATGRYLRANRRFCELVGYSEAELRERTVVDLAPPELRERARAALAAVQAGERRPWSGEQRYLRADGSVADAWMSMNFVTRADGRAVAIAIVQDLAPLRAAEAARWRSEAEYRALFEQASVAMSEADVATGRFLRANRQYCAFTGYSADELLGMTLADLLFPEDAAAHRARAAGVLAGDRQTVTVERRYRRKDGTDAWGLSTIAFFEGPDGQVRSLATVQDIGERRRAEAALALQDERMRLALRAASVIMFTQDRDLRYTWVYNPLVAPGIASRTIGKTDEELLAPEQYARLGPVKRRVLEEGVTLSEELSAPLLRDGEERTHHFRSIYQPLRDAAGAVVGLLGIGIDVTARKEAEEAQRRSEERLRMALASSPVILYAQDRDLRYTFLYNTVAGEPDDFIGLTDLEMSPSDYGERLTALKRRVLATGEPLRAELPVSNDWGAWTFDLSIEPLRDGAGAIVGVTGAAIDITARRRGEARDRLLAEAGELLASSLDPDEALGAITGLLVPRFADWCVVSTIEDGWVVRRAARHVTPAGQAFLDALIPRYRLEGDVARGVAEVIRSGQPFFRAEGSLAELAPPTDADLQLRLARGLPGAVSQIVVPLVARGRVIGAINACLGPGARRFDADDLALLEELGRRAALALDNARLYAAERAARAAAERATQIAARLQGATAALAATLTPDDVVRVALEQVVAAAGASGGLIVLIGPDRDTFAATRAIGSGAAITFSAPRLADLGPGPIVDALRTGRAIWLPGVAETAGRYPGTAAAIDRLVATGQRAWATVPLAPRDQPPGALTFCFDREDALDEGARTLILTLAGLCSQALERAYLYEAERASRSRLHQILGVLPEAVLVVDEGGAFALANATAVALLGLDPTGQPLPVGGDAAYATFGARQLDGTPYRDDDLPLERAFLHGEAVPPEQLILRNATNGRDVPVLVSAAPLRGADGTPAGAVAAFQDISRLKALERVRDEFYAAVSHDLKNPLTIVRAHTQLVQRSLRRLDAPEAAGLAERLDAVIGASARMTQLLDDLLDHARLQAGEPLELALRPTDLGALLRRLAEQWERASEGHRFVVTDDEATVVAPVDTRRLERVLENIISNAVKYSPAGRPIELGAAATDDGRGWAVLTVRDRGVGIPAAELSTIFDPYRRGTNVRGQIGGSGLGLASARRLIEQHGGTIAIASTEGAGTTVTIRLPLG